MGVTDPFTRRERAAINSNEPTFSKLPPGVDLPGVIDRLRESVDTEIAAAVELANDADEISYDPTASGLTGTDVQAAIDELAALPGTEVVADLFAVNTFVTNSAGGVVMTGTGGNDDMEYVVPVDGDGDYLVMWSGNIRTTQAASNAIAYLAKNGSSVNGTDRTNPTIDFLPAGAQAVMVACVATDTLSARLKRETGGPPFNVEASDRHMTVVKVA